MAQAATPTPLKAIALEHGLPRLITDACCLVLVLTAAQILPCQTVFRHGGNQHLRGTDMVGLLGRAG
jgi:hypothetical protein